MTLPDQGGVVDSDAVCKIMSHKSRDHRFHYYKPLNGEKSVTWGKPDQNQETPHAKEDQEHIRTENKRNRKEK